LQDLPLAGGEGLVIPGPESGESEGLVWAERFRVGVADRPVVRGRSVRESVRREHGARSGRERGSPAWGGKGSRWLVDQWALREGRADGVADRREAHLSLRRKAPTADGGR